MLKILRNRKGQNTAEYAILIGLIVAAAIAMQTYVKRNLQAGIKYVVDKAKGSPESNVFTTNNERTGQYEPYYLESAFETEVHTYTDTEEYRGKGEVERQYGVDLGKRVTRTGFQRQKASEE